MGNKKIRKFRLPGKLILRELYNISRLEIENIIHFTHSLVLASDCTLSMPMIQGGAEEKQLPGPVWTEESWGLTDYTLKCRAELPHQDLHQQVVVDKTRESMWEFQLEQYKFAVRDYQFHFKQKKLNRSQIKCFFYVFSPPFANLLNNLNRSHNTFL